MESFGSHSSFGIVYKASFKIFFKFYLKGKQRKFFHLMVHSPNACDFLDWAKCKSGAQTSVSVSHVHLTGTCCLPESALAESWGGNQT